MTTPGAAWWERVGFAALTVLGVTIIVFILSRLIGDPVALMLPPEATAEDRAVLRMALGLDRSLVEQFLIFLRDIARFDLGQSLWQRRPAAEIVLERLPWTLALTAVAITVAAILGTALGLLAALRPGSWLDTAASSTALAGLSAPQFWLGLLLVYVFAVHLHWLPSSGAETNAAIVLPALTLALPAAGRIAMIVRSGMVEELNAAYVLTARARGTTPTRIVLVHALRNAAGPAVSIIGWEAIRALAGYTAVVETVFAWPGLGSLAVGAIQNQDLVLLQAVVFTTAILVVGLNLLTDAAQRRIDPRIAG